MSGDKQRVGRPRLFDRAMPLFGVRLPRLWVEIIRQEYGELSYGIRKIIQIWLEQKGGRK